MAGDYPTFTPEELQSEIWKPVVGHEAYYSVSTLGRVRRDVNFARPCMSGRLLKPTLNQGGYHCVGLYNSDTKKVAITRLHKIVITAFIGECPEGKEVNHIDTVKTNNRISNLEYVTHLENMQHSHELGRYQSGANHFSKRNPHAVLKGEKVGNSKLKKEDIIQIRKLRTSGISLRKIAKMFTVASPTIYRIINRSTWKHIA